MLFRDVLKQARERAGLTQEALARQAGMSVGNVRNYEQGIRMPTFPAVVRLAAALGLTCQDFAGCEDVTAAEEGPPAGGKGPKPEPPRPRRKGK